MIGGWVLAMCWLQLIAGMPWMQKSESALIVHFTVALQMRIWAGCAHLGCWWMQWWQWSYERKSFPILQSFTLFPAPQKYVNRMHTAQGSTRVQKFPGIKRSWSGFENCKRQIFKSCPCSLLVRFLSLGSLCCWNFMSWCSLLRFFSLGLALCCWWDFMSCRPQKNVRVR